MTKPVALTVVVPIYNEEACIVEVVRSWQKMLRELQISYRIVLLNDGSTDSTQAALQPLEEEPDLEVINKENSGHGPTILLGYRMAVEQADWVFQVDSDNEMKPDRFPDMWCKRESVEAVFGIRHNRAQPAGRKFISWFSRLTVRLLYGKGISDVNVPYRLIRADLLARIIEPLPPHLVAPNVIVAGALIGAGARIEEERVPYTFRTTGTVSILKWKLWKLAATALFQTLAHRPRIS